MTTEDFVINLKAPLLTPTKVLKWMATRSLLPLLQELSRMATLQISNQCKDLVISRTREETRVGIVIGDAGILVVTMYDFRWYTTGRLQSLVVFQRTVATSKKSWEPFQL